MGPALEPPSFLPLQASDRLGLVTDLLALAHAGLGGASAQLLPLLERCRGGEDDAFVWQVAAEAMGAVRGVMGELRKTSIKCTLKKIFNYFLLLLSC